MSTESDAAPDGGCAGPAEAWFGPDFARLHPLLQQLHRHGGLLDGEVAIRTGRGFAGWLGRRLAAKLGVPLNHPHCRFQVRIAHEAGRMIWARRFIFPDGRTQDLVSTFTPSGHYPRGYWSETTGAMRFRLGVEILPGGGWRWQVRQARLLGMPLPLGLFPDSQAYKCIEDGHYRFQVSFVLPLLGTLLSYGGQLGEASETPAGRQSP